MILFENESCILSTLVDITGLERAEQHFRQAQKMDVVGQLAGGVAHDFNNMLSGILGFAELLKMKLTDDVSLNKYVDKIIETASRSSELTKKLLAFARKGKTVSTPIDLHSPIKEAISILERSIDKRIKITTNFERRTFYHCRRSKFTSKCILEPWHQRKGCYAERRLFIFFQFDSFPG